MEQQLRRESVGSNVQMHFLDGVVSIIPQFVGLTQFAHLHSPVTNACRHLCDMIVSHL